MIAKECNDAKTRNVFKKTGRKIETKNNLILYSIFIYIRRKRSSLSIIDYDSVSGFQQRKN